jgi:hypothetical protein
LFEEVKPDDILFTQFSIYERGNERYQTLGNKIKGWFVLEIIKVISLKIFGKSFVKRRVYSQSSGFNEDITLGENVEFLQGVKRIVKSEGGRFGQLQS